MDAHTTQSQSRISFMQCPNQRLKSRKRFVGTGVEGASDDSVTQWGCTDKCLEKSNVALILLLLIGKNGTTTEEKFGAQETNTLGSYFPGSACTLDITHVGKYLHRDPVRGGTGL